ncbi:MAG: DinB family protein [Acidobacteria bacterium]|uniref:DinB family protein n=2 Tax=Acidipila rosea TaxID=768535 RepID=A0A4R1LCX6_9BACT|nr:DinB family protein [Acidobacteriota bacterium]TCK75507.1 DinB family protein [Acidipila rosea]
MPEPWLRGSLVDVPAVARATLHALQLAEEDVTRWCADLTDIELNREPLGLPALVFHIRHLSRSLDRLLTYAEGHQLSVVQMAALGTEHTADIPSSVVLTEFSMSLAEAAQRVRALSTLNLEEPRYVGRKQLPTSLGGLLVHIADHTQRHVGEIITTVKVLKALRQPNART